MIITIKRADFSSANIGTLSTYIISKSIGSGATFDIPNFVDKNSSVNWVITLDEGYTFGTYSVTMGSAVITPTVVDNVMTISIAEVTGNVRIVVATVNENTGEEDEPVVPPVEPEEPAPDYPEISWISGRFISQEGVESIDGATFTDGEIASSSSAQNWTVTDFIDVSYYKKLTYTATIPAGGVTSAHCIYGYDSNKSPVLALLTPTSSNRTFNNFIVEVTDSRIAYIVACGHPNTKVPSIDFVK